MLYLMDVKKNYNTSLAHKDTENAPFRFFGDTRYNRAGTNINSLVISRVLLYLDLLYNEVPLCSGTVCNHEHEPTVKLSISPPGLSTVHRRWDVR